MHAVKGGWLLVPERCLRLHVDVQRAVRPEDRLEQLWKLRDQVRNNGSKLSERELRMPERAECVRGRVREQAVGLEQLWRLRYEVRNGSKLSERELCMPERPECVRGRVREQAVGLEQLRGLRGGLSVGHPVVRERHVLRATELRWPRADVRPERQCKLLRVGRGAGRHILPELRRRDQHEHGLSRTSERLPFRRV